MIAERINCTNGVVSGPWNSIPYAPADGITGNLRLNNGTIEVFCISNWIPISGEYNIQLDARTQGILMWAEDKMREERNLEELCKKYPALEKAKQNFDLIKAMVNEEIKHGST